MIELVLIRHGETDWNTIRRLQGHIDIPLNDTGLAQAKLLGAALQNEHLDAVLCSDLQRAIQTAQAIAIPKHLPCQIDDQWRERSFGGFEGQLITTLEQRFPVEYAAWRAYEPDSQFPYNADSGHHGETIRQFHARIEAALISLCQHYPDQKVAVVAHGGVLECVYRISRQLPLDAPREVHLLNASINRFELQLQENQLEVRLVQWGDITHLSASLDEINP